MDEGTIFILWILFSVVPALIARSKGRSFILYLIASLIFSPIIMLIVALIVGKDQKSIENKALASGMKKCPFCAEIIKTEASVCRYCGKEMPVSNQST